MSILLKGGVLLIHHGPNDDVHPTKADLLIRDSNIAAIGQDIDPGDAEIIDCVGKLISPGFIDTHHHVWQSCLKATHPNDTLLDYFWKGNFINSMLAPDEIFWSQLAGAMECVDSGTTTVVDHATVNYSEKHSHEALRATIGSGIRSVFGYCPTPIVSSWNPEFKLVPNMLPPWVMENFDKLATQNPFGPNGRVRLGFAFDGLWLPKEYLQPLFARVREAGAQLITAHAAYGASFGAPHAPSTVENLKSKDLLGPGLLLSHLTNPKPGDAQILAESGATISTTPSTELQMGHGNPVCFDEHLKPVSGLGIDCHSVCSAYIPGQMNLVLQWARARRHEELEAEGKWSKTVEYSVRDVYNFGTIKGARVIGMESQIGSLSVGKKADIVIFDTESPGMAVAADRDPLAAIVLHSSIRDIDTVIIDGIARKKQGRLESVKLPVGIDSSSEGETVTWKTVLGRVAGLAKEVDERKKAINPEIAENGVLQAFYMNTAARC
ncbi:unnamed protein product [Clonostachys rhizophaga]|uniref:Amidohydrolase-related domain-containing protein n=1 Tax=Clonostachys rhizophaga TaxID=160324 RepID=A0A9N9V8V4_9HYPO|nr:unnamed protein product [Clonostachys rhizophaga]